MIKYIMIGLLLITSMVMVNNPWTNEYIELLLQENTTPVASNNTSLQEDIMTYAKKYEIPPENAKIHPVWKAVPGYNGVRVNVSDSLNKMKKTRKFDENKLVFDQIKPKIHLEDLPPAPIFRGHPEKPMVGFLINVAWGNEYLSAMLEVLKEHNVSATFFLEGRWAQKNPDLTKMIFEAGHEIGNHSYSHPNMKILSREKTRQELIRTNKVIEATTGLKTRWFAPPSGSFRDETVLIANELKLSTIMWSVDTVDWQNPSVEVLLSRVLNKVHNGALILMHPTESTANSLEELILRLKEKNLQLGTVSQVLDEKRILLNNSEVGKNIKKSTR